MQYHQICQTLSSSLTFVSFLSVLHLFRSGSAEAFPVTDISDRAVTTTMAASPRPTGSEIGPFPVTLVAGINNTVELRDSEGMSELDALSIRVVGPK